MNDNQMYKMEHLTACIESAFSQFRDNGEDNEAWEELRNDFWNYSGQIEDLISEIKPAN